LRAGEERGTREPILEGKEYPSARTIELVWESSGNARENQMNSSPIEHVGLLEDMVITPEANDTRITTLFETMRLSRPRSLSIGGSWKWYRGLESEQGIDAVNDRTAIGKDQSEKMEDTDD
jgi:hypothetical protein